MPQIYAGRIRLSRPTNQRNFNGQVLTNGFDSLLRRTAVGLEGQSSTLVKYGYDKASRLAHVTNGVNVASYSYVANSPLVSQITFKNSGATRMTTTKSYDKLSRLTSIASTGGASSTSPISSAYDYNSANQRKRNSQSDGSYWSYQYDSLGQVISGKRYWNDGTPVEGQQFEYAFDDIGNRRSSKSGGDATGANLRTATYNANALNQYTSRTVPGYVDVIGAADARASVTVNSATTYRKGEYFRKELSIANSATNVLQSASVNANWGTTNDPQSGNIFLPQTPEAFWYDADGNLTNDGRWFYTWDAENRLTQIIATNVVDGARRKLIFEYDHQGRRTRKTSYHPNGAGWTVTNDHRFVYDGWNLVAELNATNNAVVRSYVWGADLSGTVKGAGGVGGLLAVNDTANGVHFAAYDGNGNLKALVKATDGTTSATYDYGPFGELIQSTGLMAKANPFRFSTKYTDDESDFLYYGYRYYDPRNGRWLSRDPIGEYGGINLYGFVYNRPLTDIDPLGLNVVGQMFSFRFKCLNISCQYQLWRRAEGIRRKAREEGRALSGGIGFDGGPEDALRHCLGGCYLKEAMDSIPACEVLTPESLIQDEEMKRSVHKSKIDIDNGVVGARVEGGKTCKDHCAQALLEKRLKTEKPPEQWTFPKP